MAASHQSAARSEHGDHRGGKEGGSVPWVTGSLTDDQLRDRMKLLENELRRRRIERCAALVDHIESECARRNLTLIEVAGALRERYAKYVEKELAMGPAVAGKRIAGAVFQHPGDENKRWMGRGKRPGWLKSLLQEGVPVLFVLILAVSRQGPRSTWASALIY